MNRKELNCKTSFVPIIWQTEGAKKESNGNQYDGIRWDTGCG